MKTRFNKLKIFSKKLKEDKMKDKDWEDLLKKMRKIDKEDKMSKKQNKTINCQQDLTHSEKSGLLQPADIHNREQMIFPNEVVIGRRYIIKTCMWNKNLITKVICLGICEGIPIFKDLEENNRVFAYAKNQINTLWEIKGDEK